MSTPPSKRRKLGRLFDLIYPPAAISASGSAAIDGLDDEVRAIIEIEDLKTDDLTVKEVFFPESAEQQIGDVVRKIEIGGNVRTALQKAGIKEESLRNAVFTDLKERHNVEFPVDSSHWRVETLTRRTLKFLFDLRYKEQSLAKVLNDFYREGSWDSHADAAKDVAQDSIVPERLLHGLLVTTTSLPDMTVIRGQNLYFGEFKNKQNYETSNAAKQCAVYLFALLYFYRVRLGRKIQAVFGFFVCGCGCFSPDKKYVVGLVRLAVPMKLGQSMRCQVFRKVYRTTDLTGLQLLVHFLRSGKVMEGDILPQGLSRLDRIPALLTLPDDLWSSPCLVKNGTESMVFKGGRDQMTPLLDQIDGLDPDDKDSLLQCVDAAEPSKQFYLKIRLTDTTLRRFPADPVARLWNANPQLFGELYCLKPKGNASLGVFLMNDCGTVLHQTKDSFLQLGVEQFLAAFRALWHKTMLLTDVLFHGDALPHNIVYDAESKRLALIDLDEGVSGSGKKAPKRVVEKSDSLPNPYLRYPNHLRSWRNRIVYTQVQLGASFLAMAQPFEEDLDLHNRNMLVQLTRAATSANECLGARDGKEADLAELDSGDPVLKFLSMVKGFIGA